jgi:hypothetical protein
LVTWVPEAADAMGLEPADRYPAGSRVARVRQGETAEEVRNLSAELEAAGGAALDPTARRLAFVGRLPGEERFSVWLADLATGGPARRLAAATLDAGQVAFLPDGRLVVSARLPGAPLLAGLTSRWALFTLDPADETVDRITWGGTEISPSVLVDGRIVYSQWQPGGDGRPEGGSLSLFTVHPDGAGAAPLHGFHDGPRYKFLTRQAPGGDLYYLARESHGETELRVADGRAPSAEGRRIDLAGKRPLDLASTADGGMLALAIGSPTELLSIDASGSPRTLSLPTVEGSRPVEIVEIAPRPRPQGQLSRIDPNGSSGQLLCVDARPAGFEGAARVRLSQLAEVGSEPRPLGEIALAEDGSFFAVVPANTPLLVDVVDDSGALLERNTSPFWVRPGEIRGCVGCHDDPEVAPPNRRPRAVLSDPIDLTGEAG